MLDWKIIVTIIVTLGLVMGYVGTNPAVSGFFDVVGDKFSAFTGDSTPRNIEFGLGADKYSDLEFTAKVPIDFVVTGYTEASLKTGNLKTNKTVGIYGFKGTGSIKSNTLTLDGKMTKVELPEITVSVQETVKSTSTFTSLSAKNLSVKELKIEKTSGSLSVRGTSTQFSGDIDISSPIGDFDFFSGKSVLSVSGKASTISIPSAGISIK